MDNSLSSAFAPESSSGKRRRKQFTRANKFHDELKALQTKINNSVNHLQHLVGVLSSALMVEENRTCVTSRIDEVRLSLDEQQTITAARIDGVLSTLQAMAQNVREVFCPSFLAPVPSHTITLDFDAKDEEGNPTTPEGWLKQSVLSKVVTVATGSIMPAHSVLGMAGVGKTVALQGLCYNEEVRKQFPDGIYFMKFGQDSTLQTAVREIAKIMTLTKASADLKTT